MMTMVNKRLLIEAKEEAKHLSRTMPAPVMYAAAEAYWKLDNLVRELQTYEDAEKST